MDIIEKAVLFCKVGHAAVGQKRKYTGEEYYKHPIEVASMVVDLPSATEEMVCAALMHDLAEDTHITLEFIEEHFGPVIAALVSDLTDVSKPEDGNRAVRKEMDRQHTAGASAQAKTIKLADLISNTKSICEHDKDFAKVYVKEKELLLEVLTEGDPVLYKQAYDLMVKCKEELGIV